MKYDSNITISLRFSDNFAPQNGTINAHKEVINQYGFVWYGKLGSPISSNIANSILSSQAKILLIHSGRTERYWAFVEEITNTVPPLEYIPFYYRDRVEKFGSWFKINKLEDAPKDVLSKYFVVSSNRPLSDVSKKSMNPYFIIKEKTNG